MASVSQPALFGARGHLRARTMLSRAISRDQLHHGLLFIGPAGVGKATVARGLARALHCKVKPAQGCGTCSDCNRIVANTHAGVEWIRPDGPAGMIKVDAARELANRLQHAPFEGDRHLVVFDPGHALNETALNALLKSIEEPPAGVHFVFIVTHTETLLPTIVSRCLPVRFGGLDAEDLSVVLEQTLAARVAQAEADNEPAPSIPPERRALALRLSQGSAGTAVELALDEALDAALSLLSLAVDATIAGPTKIFGGDKSALWQGWLAAYGGPGPGRPARERAACARLTELWLLDLSGRMRASDGLPGVAARPNATTEGTVRELDLLLSLRESLSRNPNVRLALEQTLLEVSRCRAQS